MELIGSDVRIDFLGKKYMAYLLSGIFIGLFVFYWTTLGDRKFGIDYLGGHELVVRVSGDTNASKIRDLMQGV
ncbi:MAG: hypothetical protein KDD60_08010, partial [Bdellovibrionales bacterium]|nr:hypothetical protein [Bdellovibrionales bacterium]